LVHSTKLVKLSAAPHITTDIVRPWCMFCDDVDLGTVFGLFSVVIHWLLCHMVLALVNSVQGITRKCFTEQILACLVYALAM
jgi:uncharacterized membrane protein YvlD (DUF360 family)